MLPFRIMLVGGKFGPGVFDIAAILGKEETINRIKKCFHFFNLANIICNTLSCLEIAALIFFTFETRTSPL